MALGWYCQKREDMLGLSFATRGPKGRELRLTDFQGQLYMCPSYAMLKDHLILLSVY